MEFKQSPMSDNLEEVFGISKLNIESWILFTTNFLKEINYSKDSTDVIELIYQVNGNEVIYFARMSELANILLTINDSRIKYKFEEIDNKVFINF